MEFKIKTKKFFEIVKKISKIMPNNINNEQYRYLLINVDENAITFFARNEKIEIEAIINDPQIVTIAIKGACALNIKIINDIFAKIKDEWVYFEKKINQIIISNKSITNNFIFRLNLWDNGIYQSNFNTIEKLIPIMLPINIINNYANQIAFTINPNNPNINLNGASFLFDNNSLIITGTDMYSLAQAVIPIINNAKINKEVIIPAIVLNDLEKIFSDSNKTLSFYLPSNENVFLLKDDTFLVKGSLLANKAYFINKDKILDTKNILQLIKNNEAENIITINMLKNFINIMQLAVILAKKEVIPLVALTFDKLKQQIKIDCFSIDNEWGTAEKQFHEVTFQQVVASQTRFQIIFNYILLINALKAFTHCETVTLTILEHSQRTIITSDQDPTIIHLVLPYKK